MTTVLRRVRRLLMLLACAALPAVCLARREVPVFTVDVPSQTPAALAQAMRAVLVRATGHARAADDPELATLVANAAQYVQGYQQGPAGELEVTFRAGALAQAISAAGRNLWNADRPFTLIVLSPAPGQTQQATDAAAVQQAAETRGLPISIVPLKVRAADGQRLASQRLLTMVHNLGAEQLLIGRDLTVPLSAAAGGASSSASPAAAAQSAAASAQGADGSAAAMPSDLWHWTLVTPFITRQFTGTLTTGIDATVDLLAPPLTAAPAGGTVATRVRIEGVKTLDDYARVETMLAAAPGIGHSSVVRVGATAVVFDLWVRGGESALQRVLALSPRFRPLAAAGMLTYRYLPPAASTP